MAVFHIMIGVYVSNIYRIIKILKMCAFGAGAVV